MAEHDLRAVAFPTLNEAQIEKLETAQGRFWRGIETDKRSSRSASETSSFSSSSPVSSRLLTNPATRQRPSRFIGPESSPAT